MSRLGRAIISAFSRNWSLQNASDLFRRSEPFITGLNILNTSQAWRDSVWVRACIEVSAATAATVPLQLEDDAGAKITTHPFYDLIRDPNPTLQLNAMQLSAQTLAIRDLFGDGFWMLGRSAKGFGKPTTSVLARRGSKVPTDVWLLNPNWVAEDVDRRTGELRGWIVTVPESGEKFFVDREDMAHFPRFDPLKMNPFRPGRGTSVLESARLAISGHVAAQRYNLGFFDRGAIPDGMLSTEQDLSEEVAEQILERWRAKHRGRSHEPTIAHSGLKWQPTNVAQRDAEFTEGQKLSRDEIVGAFHIPGFVLGITDKADYANSRMQVRNWWLHTLKPMLYSYAAVIENRLIAEPGVHVVPNFDNIEALQDTREEKLVSAKKYFDMGVPYNTIDEKLDLGMGKIPGGDVGYLPYSLSPASMMEELAQSTLDDGNADGGGPAGGDGDSEPDDQEPADPEKMWEGVRAVLEKHAERTTKSQDDLVDEVDAILAVGATELQGFSEEFLKLALQLGAAQAAALLGDVDPFSLDSPDAVLYLRTKAIKITGIQAITREAIRELLVEALESGISPQELTDRVRDIYNFSTARAAKIARTEVGQAINSGRFFTYRKEGVRKHEWISARDNKVRASHTAEDGHKVEIGVVFPVTKCKYPGDPDGPANEVVNCRCIAIPADGARSAVGAEESERAEFWRKSVATWGPLERRFERRLSRFFRDQRAAVLKTIAERYA